MEESKALFNSDVKRPCKIIQKYPFYPEQKNFDWNNCLHMAAYSMLAYANQYQLYAVFIKRLKFTRIYFFDYVSTFAYLAVKEVYNEDHTINSEKSYQVLAFRGTEADYLDILTDLKVIKRKVPGKSYRVHGGILTSFQEIQGHKFDDNRRERVKWVGREGLSNHLKYHKNLNLFITGHSLGAGLATIGATYFSPSVLYTFGSPRVFSFPIKEKIPHSYRIVNGWDIVTCIPFIGFKHIGLKNVLGNRAIYYLGILLNYILYFWVLISLIGFGLSILVFPIYFFYLKEIQLFHWIVKTLLFAPAATILMVIGIILINFFGLMSFINQTVLFFTFGKFGIFKSFTDHKIGQYLSNIERKISD